MDQRPTCKTWNNKLYRKNISIKLIYLGLRENFMDLTSKGRERKAKKRTGLYHTKKLLYSKRNCQQNKKATNGMGEDIFKENLPYINVQNI